MKVITGIVGLYFLIIAALNVYFATALQSGGALLASLVSAGLFLERPLVWIFNKIPFLYVGNMNTLSSITMRSSVIMLCASLLLLIGCVLLIRVED